MATGRPASGGVKPGQRETGGAFTGELLVGGAVRGVRWPSLTGRGHLARRAHSKPRMKRRKSPTNSPAKPSAGAAPSFERVMKTALERFGEGPIMTLGDGARRSAGMECADHVPAPRRHRGHGRRPAHALASPGSHGAPGQTSTGPVCSEPGSSPQSFGRPGRPGGPGHGRPSGHRTPLEPGARPRRRLGKQTRSSIATSSMSTACTSTWSRRHEFNFVLFHKFDYAHL